MKYLVLFLLITGIGCGECAKNRQFDLEVVYLNGDKETVHVTSFSCGGNAPYLRESCIEDYSYEAVRCGVRSFKIIKVY